MIQIQTKISDRQIYPPIYNFEIPYNRAMIDVMDFVDCQFWDEMKYTELEDWYTWSTYADSYYKISSGGNFSIY